MKNILKIGLLSLIALVSLVVPISADEKADVCFTAEEENSTREIIDCYSRYLVRSTAYRQISYGGWKVGSTGLGPGTLTESRSRTYSNSITGSIAAPISSINAALGFTVNKSATAGTSYSIKLGNKERKTILYREKYNQYTVNQQEQIFCTSGSTRWTNNKRTAYANKFISWDYTWRSGY